MTTNQPAETANQQHRPIPVVGIGASAGGLEALEKFFAHVPADAPLAFVVVQHLHAEYPSSMAEILAQHAKLTVAPAEDGVVVQPGHVYVIPPNAVITMAGGALSVTSPAEPRRALIDHFFCSLAEDQAHNAIGVILSGAGTDGTIGIKAIKEHGGLAMAQALSSARYDSMPRSAIALGLVDFVLPAEEMPAKLIEYAAQLATMPEAVREGVEAEPSEQIRAVCSILRRVTGHDFSKYKQPTLFRRIQRRMLVLQISSLGEYVERLRGAPDEATQLFKDLLIGVTQFFRDPEAFEALSATVLPRLFEGKREDRELRVWVPGCASGEEAYSIAILLREGMAAVDRAPVVKIFATDIDEHALDVARAGRYPEGIADQVSAARLGRFFTKQGGVYQIDKSIREMCIFSVHSLINDPPFSRLDLISCRNLLIYLEADLQKKLVPLFHYALRSGGHLLLGPSENLAGSPELFTAVDKKARIFRRNDAVLAPQVTFPVFEPTSAGPVALGRPPPPVAGRPGDIAKTFERVLLAHYAPAAVVINERAEILYVSGRTGKYFELSPGAVSVNAIDMARKGLRPDLHTAIHKAVKSRKETVHENVTVEINGYLQRTTLTVRPLEEIEPGSGLFMVVFQDLGAPINGGQADAAVGPPAPADQLAQALESELRSTKEHLKATIEELEASNEELKSSNEELLSTNEELQSTNEEMQTSKEELQSINEELQTVNTELSRKVEELDRANSDLQNLFANTNVATIFLDNDLHIKKFSPEATEIFRILPTDVGRPLTDFASPFTGADLIGSVREVLRTLVPREQQVKRTDGDQWFIQRVRPYRSLDNVIGGAVLTFLDVTALKQAERRITLLAALVDSSQDAIVGMTFDGEITTWNAGARRVFGQAAEDVVGRSVSMLTPPDEPRTVTSALPSVRQGVVVAPYETTFLRKDGPTFPGDLTLSPVVEQGGEPVGVSMIARDVTERRQREEERAALHAELEAERGRLQTIFDNVPFGVALVEAPSGRVVLQSRGAEPVTAGLPSWADVGLLGADGSPVDPGRRPLSRALGGEVVEGEDYLYRRDGAESRWLRVTAAPLRGRDEAITGSVVTFLDVDNEKRAERALQETDRRKNEFLATLAHELRNPLAPICNVTRVLRSHEIRDAAFQKALDMIDRQSSHMARLIDDLLDVSRISRGKITLHPEPLDLVALCRAVLADHAEGARAASLTLSPVLPDGPVWVEGDAVRLSQVVTNLLTNAVKFTNPGGRISVGVSADADRGEAIVRVRDTGIGMTKDLLARAFTPFAQADGAAERGGLGLGLSVVRGIVELHGGTVEAASEGPGRGSEITVRLPLSAPPEALPEAPPIPSAGGDPRARRVLLIEDNDDIRESTQWMLEIAGHEVAVAAGGAEGLEKAAAFRPDVVLCDIGLPGGMDGYAVARALRADPALSSARRIAMTGYGQEEDQRRAIDAGFHDHATKPVDADVLERLVSAPA